MGKQKEIRSVILNFLTDKNWTQREKACDVKWKELPVQTAFGPHASNTFQKLIGSCSCEYCVMKTIKTEYCTKTKNEDGTYKKKKYEIRACRRNIMYLRDCNRLMDKVAPEGGHLRTCKKTYKRCANLINAGWKMTTDAFKWTRNNFLESENQWGIKSLSPDEEKKLRKVIENIDGDKWP